MKKLLLGLILLALPLSAQERIDLAVPIVATNTGYTIETITLGWTVGTITLYLRTSTGEAVTCIYGPNTNPTGVFLLTALNKANLSAAYANNATTGSLKQRIAHRLMAPPGMNEAPQVCGVTITGSLAGSVP